MKYFAEYVTIMGKQYPRFMGGPIDGYTDSPFRQLVRRFSPDNLLYTQMRHVASIACARAAHSELDFTPGERPLNFQITANSLRFVKTAVERIIARGVDSVDLNIACPAKNIVKGRSGSAMMANLALLEQVLKQLRELVPCALTVKMRAGFKAKNALDVVRLSQDCGVDALAIHPRLQTQRFGGELDYGLVREIKELINIPVLYSGGIITLADAQWVYERTGVDGFLVGRALCGNPWRLAELAAHAAGKMYHVSAQQKIDTMLVHLDLMINYYGEQGLYNFRKHIPFYIVGFEGASAVRQRLVTAKSVEEVKHGLCALCEGELIHNGS